MLTPAYLRLFRYDSFWYGIAMPGAVFRSRDGITRFERGPELFGPSMRHCALWRSGDSLHVFFTRAGDRPERILLSTIRLSSDWTTWKESPPSEILRPERAWEGADCPLEASLRSAVSRRVNQLRDPAVYLEGDEVFLLYAVAGESGIGIARLERIAS